MNRMIRQRWFVVLGHEEVCHSDLLVRLTEMIEGHDQVARPDRGAVEGEVPRGHPDLAGSDQEHQHALDIGARKTSRVAVVPCHEVVDEPSSSRIRPPFAPDWSRAAVH